MTDELLAIPPLFALGDVVMTIGAHEALAAQREASAVAGALLRRHETGDWGELEPEDWSLNDQALEQGERILSCYPLPAGGRLWIITEWDRSVTTLLLPEEY